ncbi:hypothetical protein EDD18DRAFT_1356179 [Armillaria luteobubalina]|uniref:Ribonuclease H1 N-terminal domain-containing protein n=1 Tax=Armillaria luteobubalina TaxID=153913 RepID=A0AA39Q007_9AGAR|nr:hypothetical protein EDD18DRAFT_1356179 [Armillaria luteobubalina]
MSHRMIRSSTPLVHSPTFLSTESSLSTDSLSEALSVIIISDDDKDPPLRHIKTCKAKHPIAAPTVFPAVIAAPTWYHKSNVSLHDESTTPKPSSLSSSPSPCTSGPSFQCNAQQMGGYQHPALPLQCPHQPRVMMRATGCRNGFYVIMNGRTMGVFDAWNLTEGSFLGVPHQSYRKFPTLDDAIATWTNQEIGYQADRHSNQSCYGPVWVMSQQCLTHTFYWLVVKGWSPGIYTVFEDALNAAGVAWYEVVIVQDYDMASRLFQDFEHSHEVNVITAS